jgi:hypothetical protein
VKPWNLDNPALMVLFIALALLMFPFWALASIICGRDILQPKWPPRGGHTHRSFFKG